MSSGSSPMGELVAMGLIAGLVAFGLALAAKPPGAPRAGARAPNVIEAGDALFDLHPGSGRLSVQSRDGALSSDLYLELVVDGEPRPLSLGREDLRRSAGVLRATFPVPLGDDTMEATLEMQPDAAHDALVVDLASPPGLVPVGHTLALRAELSSDGQPVFVSGVGPIADRATVTGGALLVDAAPHPLGLTTQSGPLTVDAMIEEALPPGEPMRVAAATAPRSAAAGAPLADLRIAVGKSSESIWGALTELTGRTAAVVRGRVTGTTAPALVFGRDAQGLLQVRARAGEGGAFDLAAPTSVVEWYAAIDPARASSVVPFVPGTPHELLLDVSPGGDLHVSIIDADTRKPLTARLLVHGIDGTVDPSFGPDYRASGAGPIIDALRGDVTTPLPSGRYRVAATKGIEWSVDAKEIEIVPGRVTDVELAPRHVVPTPGVLGCDLHVHARPSFDSPVTPEDRVLSLVAAGIDFAVPTEHNIVGDYSSALETLNLNHELLSVTGVEVTTVGKGFGHFGVFPYPPSQTVPPFKHTSMNAIFRAVRAGDPARYFQLNHPRLPKGLGYFSNIGFDPKGPRSRIHNRVDFDGIEVFNGYDDEKPERVEQVLRDYWALLDFGWRYAATGSSDSHRIQYHWAGYPRTMVTVDPHATSDADDAKTDPLVVVANIKKGHATVTSGPIIELELGGARPGEELDSPVDRAGQGPRDVDRAAVAGQGPRDNNVIAGHLRVRAAPWVDVSRIEIVVGTIARSGGGSVKVVQTFDVPARPTQLGPEPGTLEEAQERTIRFDRDIQVPVGADNGWVMVVARGTRPMDDVLPFMPVPPLGFTNPVYVVRRPVPPPPFPTAPGIAPSR